MAKDNDSKKKIVKTALRLIRRHGYDSVTINQICAEADIAKNTFYYYFSSKEDLLLHFYEIAREKSVDHLAGILEEESCLGQYVRSMSHMLHFITENGPETMRDIARAHISQRQPDFAPPKSDCMDLAAVRTTIIKRGQATGEIRSLFTPPSLDTIAQAQFFGLVHMWCISSGKFDLREAFSLSLEALFDVSPEFRCADPNALSRVFSE